MTDFEFTTILQRLRGAYNMLADASAQQVWLYSLREYSYQDICDACDHYIRTYSQRPTIADIINETRRVRSERRVKEQKLSMQPAVCPHCRNRGLVMREIEGGYTVGRPCTACAYGRINYPGYFKDLEAADRAAAAASPAASTATSPQPDAA